MKNALFLLAALTAAAQKPGMLTSTDSLAKLLNDKALVLLHVGSQKDYDESHIPGSRLITLADISVTDDRGMRMQLPPVPELIRAFGKLGVTEKSKIVVYPAGESIQSATRVWFTLDYLGLSEQASLLDGGLLLWKAQKRETTTEPTPPLEATTFIPKPNPELVVDAAWIGTRLEGSAVQIYDARLPEFYTGANAGGMPRAGHLPGAVNVPYPTMLASDRTLQPAEQLRALLNVPAEKTLVTYCHIGMQATVPYFVARYLGYQPKLYDGSFQDWSARAELPVQP
ncbi:MAG: sulfurtransferase [Bryobacteraceae bacterium]|nr:sulfurtransferase [Bryobacteraceae bacterium]